MGFEANRGSLECTQKLQTCKKVLIKHINELSDRGLPPTPQIVKNLAEEIIHAELGKNWVSRFIRRRHGQLISGIFTYDRSQAKDYRQLLSFSKFL
jgi:hypothetical protein